MPELLEEKHAFNVNGHLMVSVAVNTTGIDPTSDQLFEITMMPVMGDFSKSKQFPTLTAGFKTSNPRAIKVKQSYYNEVFKFGMDYYEGASYALRWFEGLGLRHNKKLTVLAWDWTFIAPFIREWLGPTTYDLMFMEEVRDIRASALYVNDRCRMYTTNCPFAFPKLTNVARKVGVGYVPASKDSTAYRAFVQAKVYRKLLHHLIPNEYAFNQGVLVPDPEEALQ